MWVGVRTALLHGARGKRVGFGQGQGSGLGFRMSLGSWLGLSGNLLMIPKHRFGDYGVQLHDH